MARLSQARRCARHDLGHHLALGHGAVREHRLAGHVADGIDAAHRGLALVVDADEAPIHVEDQLLDAPPGRGRLPADRDEDPAGRKPDLRAVGALDEEAALRRRRTLPRTGRALSRLQQPPRPGAGDHLDPEVLQTLRDRLGQVPIVERKDLRQGLDDADLGPELREGGAELQADITRSDHDEPVGHVVERQRLR